MKMVMLATLMVAVGLTSACATSTRSTDGSTYSSTSAKPNNQADCERAGGKWKSILHHCDMDD